MAKRKAPAAAAAAPETPPGGTPLQDRVLDAALACFRRWGGQRTRIEDIAAAAGMARTAVYRFYPNKRAIVAALAARALEADATALAQIARDGGRPAPVRLKALLLAEAERVAGALGDVCLAEVIAEVMANIADVYVQHRRTMRALYRGVIQDGIKAGAFRRGDPDRLAQTLEDLTLLLHDPRLAAAKPARRRCEDAVEAALTALAAA